MRGKLAKVSDTRRREGDVYARHATRRSRVVHLTNKICVPAANGNCERAAGKPWHVSFTRVFMLPPDEKGYKITPFHRRCFIGNRGGERERVAFSNPCCCTPFLPLLERFLFFFPDKRSVIKQRNFVCNLVRGGGGGIFRPSNYECLRMIQEWIVLIRIEISFIWIR